MEKVRGKLPHHLTVEGWKSSPSSKNSAPVDIKITIGNLSELHVVQCKNPTESLQQLGVLNNLAGSCEDELEKCIKYSKPITDCTRKTFITPTNNSDCT
eukprot:11575-Ditylum_brightwellii.AAC.1